MKKLCAVILIFSLVLTGCGEPKESFQDYLDQLLVESYDATDIGINFSFINPEDFGIEPEPYDLGFVTREEYEESFSDVEEIIKELKSYKDKNLTEQEILDRDALIADFELSLGAKDYYDYQIGTNVLGYSRAFSGNVPAYLETYDFHNERDVIGYLNLLETLEASYSAYLDLEIERQASGHGFGQGELDEMIQQAKDSALAMSDPDYFLIEDFATKIKALNLDKETEYIEKQKELMNVNVSGAYALIEEKLSTITAEPSTGIVNKPDGKAYYEYLIQSSTGSSRSVASIRKFVEKKRVEAITELVRVTGGDLEPYFNRYRDSDFGSFKDGYEALEFLDSAIKDDFPAIGEVNYEILNVHPSMKEASSPAFYFTPYTDYTSDYLQTIYINEDYSNSLFETMAHEGLPGHMYQFNYFLGLDMHPIRMLYTQSSNAEGWANYIESIAYSYVEEDEDLVDFARAYNSFLQIMYIDMDLGINYDGWSYEEFYEYFEQNFGITEDTDVEEMYVYFAHNPAVYPTYFLSTLYINDMKDQVKKAKGSDYSEKEFHEVFLKSGSVGFDLIQKQIDAYIGE